MNSDTFIRVIMKKKWKKLLLLLVIALLAVYPLARLSSVLTFDALKENSVRLAGFVEENYLLAVFAFGVALVSTAFIVPGALILTVGGGYLFGAALGSLYAAVFSTAGAVLAFLASRYFIGNWVQERFRRQLRRFNHEIYRRGNNYLFVLRIIPVMPFFVVNYLAGLTRMSTAWFTVVTFLGMAPGAVIYSIAGRQLATIKTPEDILSPGVLIGLFLLAVFALLPTLYQRFMRVIGKHK